MNLPRLLTAHECYEAAFSRRFDVPPTPLILRGPLGVRETHEDRVRRLTALVDALTVRLDVPHVL